MTGIGINLREDPDKNGHIRLKVLGIILDGPANSAGVRQIDYCGSIKIEYANILLKSMLLCNNFLFALSS